MLGGGHGWLQGQHGLLCDQLLSARLILGDGSAITVSNDEHRRQEDVKAHLDPVLELNLAAGVDADVLERLADQIVGLAAGLEGRDDGRFVDSPGRVGVDRTAVVVATSSGQLGNVKDAERT